VDPEAFQTFKAKTTFDFEDISRGNRVSIQSKIKTDHLTYSTDSDSLQGTLKNPFLAKSKKTKNDNIFINQEKPIWPFNA
jgi:hemerythrin superfamily protein